MPQELHFLRFPCSGFLSCHHLKRMGRRLMFWSFLGLHMFLKWCCTGGTWGCNWARGGNDLYGVYSWPVCVYVQAEKLTLCSNPLYVQLFLFGAAFWFNENWGPISIAWDAGTTHPMGEPLSPCFALSGSFIFVVLSFFMQIFFFAFNVLIGCRLGSNQHWWGGSTV